MRKLATLSMHLLDHIDDGPVSVVGLAPRSGQRKGTVSEHVQRLVDAGLMRRTPVPGDRKEIELTLTADGPADFLKRYSNAELAVLTKVLGDVMAAEKVEVRIAPAE
ncbi:DNA-binding MarR family transcriptional regulator [Mycobacterium sp. URHB0021]